MRDFSIVLKAIFKQRWRAMWELKAGSKLGRVGMGVLIGVSFLILIGAWSTLCASLTIGFAAVGQSEIVLFGAFFAAMVMTLVFCIASVIGNLFSATDGALLASMPLKPGAVFFARFAMIYITELLIALALCLPALVCHMVIVGGGAWTLLVGLIVILLLPAMPLALASLLSLLLMRSSAFMRHRERIMTVFGVLFTIVMCFGGQLLGQSMGGMDASEMDALLAGTGNILQSMSAGFPPLAWAAEAVALVGGCAVAALRGLGYIACCVGALLLAGFVGSKTYFKGLSSSYETASKKKRGKVKLDRRSLVASSPVRACLRRERMGIMRSPTYATNCLIGVIMFPLMIAVIPIITAMRIPDEYAPNVSMFDLYPTLFAEMGASSGIVFASVFAVFMFVTFANIAACTAISREGEGFALMKSLPIKFSTQCIGKLLFAAIVNVITMLLTAIVAVVFVRTMWLEVLLAGISGALASVASAALGMTVDVLRPKLKWQSEAEAVKQNINGFFGMLLNILLAAVIAVPTFFVSMSFGVWAGFGLSFVLGGGLSALGVFLLCLAADNNLPKVVV